MAVLPNPVGTPTNSGRVDPSTNLPWNGNGAHPSAFLKNSSKLIGLIAPKAVFMGGGTANPILLAVGEREGHGNAGREYPRAV